VNFEKSDEVSNIRHRIIEEVRAYAIIGEFRRHDT